MPHIMKQMISFFLTTKCNLNCIYCYNSVERNKVKDITLPFECAKSGIDWYWANTSSRHIRFYGPGEPTQAYELMRKITEYAKGKSDKVTMEIQTNGVFNAKVREWLLNNANIIWLSFDGTPDIQNHNRPVRNGKPSSPIIESNAKWLIKHSNERDLMVGARVTMTDNNNDRQIEMVDYFSSLGIKYIWTNPLFYSVDEKPVCFDIEKQSTFHFNMDEYIKRYLEARIYAEKKGVFWGSFLAVNFDGESCYNCRACSPTPHLTPDGYLSACDMVVLGQNAHHMDCLIYGRWDSNSKKFELDNEKIRSLRERKSTNLSLQHCNQCEVRLHCGGYCLGEVVNETGKLNGIPSKCSAVKRLYHEIGECQPYPFLHP